MSYSQTRNQSNGIREIHRAQLTKQSTKGNNTHTDMMLNYINLETGTPGRCYQLLIMTFNDQKLEL